MLCCPKGKSTFSSFMMIFYHFGAGFLIDSIVYIQINVFII